jgi:hypothetical protein
MNVRDETASIEEQLREAELAPDPSVFERVLADDAVFVSNGDPSFARRT